MKMDDLGIPIFLETNLVILVDSMSTMSVVSISSFTKFCSTGRGKAADRLLDTPGINVETFHQKHLQHFLEMCFSTRQHVKINEIGRLAGVSGMSFRHNQGESVGKPNPVGVEVF